jgi:hypothetical protein
VRHAGLARFAVLEAHAQYGGVESLGENVGASSPDEGGRDGRRTGEPGRVARFVPSLIVFGLGCGAQNRARDAEFYAFELPGLQHHFTRP